MKLLDNNGEKVQVLKTKDTSNDWDIAHNHLDTSESKEFFEPIVESVLYKEQVSALKIKSVENGYLQSWPQPKEEKDNLVWYLNDNFSQLRKAKEEVINKLGIENCKIKIAIIDTGYQVGHPALPKNLKTGISFIKGEVGQAAIDKTIGSFQEQDGHGTATMSILAGQYVDIKVAGQTYEGDFGAIPFAEIIPIRICETVALIRTDAFVEAVEYAINQGCEVISMSMAGAPTKAWATVVNKAYENGVILVTAAGNSWYKGVASMSPKRLLYPARWDRVIAATGVAYNQKPYVMDAQEKVKEKGGSSEDMQGNYGPESAMNTALAAYTPNTTWATLNDENNPFRLNGGGTSSATPQIAAAAALWIVRYRKEIDDLLKDKPTDKWRKVEMVRRALFSSADKSYPESRKYFGQGVLRAFDALSILPSTQDLKKSEEASVSLWGIMDLLGLLLRLKSGNNEDAIIRGEMFSVEILQELHNNPKLHKFLDYEKTYIWSPEEKDEIKKELLKSKNISTRLKEYFEKG